MRNISKQTEPQVLRDSKAIWQIALESNPTDTNKNKYSHPEIKAAIREECWNKCVYCESKVGHNCPGDIEHKIPKTHRVDLTFEWNNMTLSCSECNRRKGDYYDSSCMFLDPYIDDVESLLIHLGPIVLSKGDNPRCEITIRILELDSKSRSQLVDRKYEKLENVRNLIARIHSTTNTTLKSFLIKELYEMSAVSAEFSAMVKEFVAKCGISQA